MTKLWAGVAAGALMAGLAGPAAAQQAPTAAGTADARADALVRRMTRDEKLTLVFGYFNTDQKEKNFTAPDPTREGSAGYVPGIPRLGIPPQWQTDAGVGVATQGPARQHRERTALPSGLATAATWDPAVAHAGGAMIGDEAKRSGFNVMLAGGVDLMREPRNGRNFEYGGEDPLLAGTIVGEEIAGIQSNGVIATIKHYAINDQETDRDTGNSIIDPGAARTSDLLGFQIGVEHGAPGSAMCSYNHVNGVFACENPFLLTQVLKQDWAWPGYVMSDWGATHSTVPAANAGLDQDSGAPFDTAPFFGPPLKAAVASGQVSGARLDDMARRIVRSMIAHGLFDKPTTVQPDSIDYTAHADVTRGDAEAGAVLLQNKGGLLPLGPKVRTVAIIGGHADKGVLAGGGSSLVYPRGGNAVPGIEPTKWPGPIMYYPSSPMAELQKLMPGVTVRFADGSDPAAAAALAKSSDVAIVFGTQWAGESFDVPLTLDGNGDALIDAVARAQPRTAVVLETGGPVLTPWAGKVAAVLEAWYPGTAGGAAIANLLSGRANPSGHLPATFPASLDQLPRPATPNKGDTTYTEGAAVGYKWYDAKGLKPAFAFGHGLSYSSFRFAGLKAAPAGMGVSATFNVTNTGKVAGAAVPQVYVSPAAGGGWEAPKRLGGWQKVTLRPGETKAVTVTVDPRLLATWDEAGHGWKVAAGAYRLTLARSAIEAGETASVTVPAATVPVGWRPADARAQ